MAHPSYAPVIASKFIAQSEFNVIIHRFSGGELVSTDSESKILFIVRSCDTTFHHQRLMQDGCGKTVATLRDKNMSVHDRWNVFRGESKADSDNIFSAATNHVIQYRTHVKVFLANNKSDDCDFRIKGSWSKKNCTLYKGESSSTIIAQMHLCEEDKFTVTVYPNVDYAFVVALIAIVDAMKNPKPDSSAASAINLLSLASS